MHPTAPSASLRRLLLGASALACLAVTPHALAWEWGASNTVEGDGKIARQAREVGHFSGVSMSLSGKVDVRRGDREGVTVEVDGNLLPLIETVVEDGTLKIRAKRGTNLRTRNLKVSVQARELDRLSLGGSGTIDADRLDGKRAEVEIGGSGTVNVGQVDTERMVVALGGSGDLKAAGGNARTVSISIGGSGKVDLGHVRADSANVSVAGAGDAVLWARDSLSLTVAGSGDVGYYGDPKISKTVMGSGNLRRLGPAPR